MRDWGLGPEWSVKLRCEAEVRAVEAGVRDEM